MKQYDYVIVGGGASALFFLQVFLENKSHFPKILLIEAKDQLGKKILATGNGRCNVLPAPLNEACFYTSEKSLEKLQALFEKVSYEEIYQFFQKRALMFLKEENRLYPRSMQAQSVLFSLIQELSVETLLGTEVVRVNKEKNFCLFLKKGEEALQVEAKNIIFAIGGLASQACFTSKIEEICSFVSSKDIAPRNPALVPIECKDVFKSLSGLRWRGKLSLKKENVSLASEEGEILFTDYGFSGIPALNLSLFVPPKEEKQRHFLSVDLFPEHSEEALLMAWEKIFSKKEAEALWLSVFPQKLFTALLKTLHQKHKKNFESYQEATQKFLFEHARSFVQLCKNFSFEIKEPRAYAYAQITKGGVKLSSLKKGASLAYASEPNCYFLGECLDVQALCGGNNLYFAWLSAYALAKELGEKNETF